MPDSSPDPRAELTNHCVKLWRQLLDRDDLEADSHFFIAGGQSLLAAKLVHEISGIVGFRVRMTALFTAPTPRQLAEFIASQPRD